MWNDRSRFSSPGTGAVNAETAPKATAEDRLSISQPSAMEVYGDRENDWDILDTIDRSPLS
jgi:hypothetical protein